MSALPRSYLFVPGDRHERFAKALASAADAVVLDLEDAVAPALKEVAREAVSTCLAQCAEPERLVVRINDESTHWFNEDLVLLRNSRAHAVMLTKAERAETVACVRAACPDIVVLPLMESARGVLAAEAIASAPGVQRLVFGTIDYALDMGLEGELSATLGLDVAGARLAIASRAAGIGSPVAGVTVAIDDEPALVADFARARALGFGAKLCIHPKQIAAVHATLQPTTEELAWARRVLAAAADAGGAAVQLDGRMVDKPVIERARRIVQRAG